MFIVTLLNEVLGALIVFHAVHYQVYRSRRYEDSLEFYKPQLNLIQVLGNDQME